jgi:hypothetical protein
MFTAAALSKAFKLDGGILASSIVQMTFVEEGFSSC